MWAARFLLIGFIVHALAAALLAQDPFSQPSSQPATGGTAAGETASGGTATGGTATGGATAQPGAAGAVSPGTVGQYPSAPTGFYRGNSPQQPVMGFYINILCVLAVIGVFAAWGYSSWWVDEDSRSLKVRPEFWNTMMLLGGTAGFLLVLITPSFVGFIPLLALYGVPLGFYIQERNARVPEASKVMTPQHIRNVAIRTLAKVGIHIGSQELIESAIGPSITFIGKSTTGRGDDVDRSRQVENSRGYLAAKELVYDAIQRRGTDIHLEPKEDELSVRVRIDGVMYPTEPYDRATGDALVNIFKVLSAMDITERRRPQDGSFRAELEGRQIDFRVNTQGTRFGEKMSMRILDQSNSVNRLAGLGFRKQLLEKLQEVIHQPHGLMLVCGPTGAGKSTTLYAALNEIDSTQRNIITVEDPVEYKMDNVNQIEINNKAGQTFATSLRSILRQDPDVVMIGEIRDGETASIACQAANTGHMVFSTVHANDTLTALYRVIELGVEPYMLANSISAILAQRLCRRLCPECKEAYKPKPEFLKQAGLPADKIEVFYRPPKDSSGCTKCGGLGFQGRTGVFEALVINDRMRDMIREKAPLSAFKAEARKNGMLSMKEEGLRLVVKGLTSIDELLRVVK